MPYKWHGIRQLEVVKQYGFVSFRSGYKEYLRFGFKVTLLYSTLFDLNFYIAL